jgi:hypothetical protein
MTNNDCNGMMIQVLAKAIQLKSIEKNEYNKGQLDAYINVLKMSGLTDNDINEIMKGNR